MIEDWWTVVFANNQATYVSAKEIDKLELALKENHDWVKLIDIANCTVNIKVSRIISYSYSDKARRKIYTSIYDGSIDDDAEKPEWER